MAERSNWGSKIGFILAASGSAIGLGNLWRFPYTAGNNGGGAFLFCYLLSVIVIALPVLIAELSLGRFTQRNPVGAYQAIRDSWLWKGVGYLGVVSGLMILSFYSVVAGWTVGYFAKAVSGHFSGITPEKAAEQFGGFVANPWLQIVLLTIFIAMTVYIVAKGISGGIEKYSKLLMPMLFGILLLMLVRSLTLDGAGAGIKFYLTPDFSKITAGTIIAAMGQAFFSLSLGMGTMITYGSYLGKQEKIPSAAGWVAFLDTAVAVMAGFIVFPALFSQGINPADQGTGVMFNILPVLFDKMPLGFLFGPLFFVLLAIAALTSTISLLEVPVAYYIDQKGWGRKKAAYIIGAVSLLFAIPSALSQGPVPFLSKLPLINRDFLSLWDFIWGNLSLSIGAFMVAIFVGYIWKSKKAVAEIRISSGFNWAPLWEILIKFICPILILLILMGLFL
ncbi:MAG: sodium-dependent transporter [Dehalococcoidia bacterium]|nr:MAG: sodium-dependent transporter [Dehalococcoidia bacterium]